MRIVYAGFMNESTKFNIQAIKPPSVLVVCLLTALAAGLVRGLVLVTHSVSFHADEAIVGLMARHILEGSRPVFFYGQAYMGSLDAWITAVGFAVLGESVATMRIMQTLLYALATGLGAGLAWRLTERGAALIVTGVLLVCPPVLITLYTTATLGGYNETLIFGTLIVWLAVDLGQGGERSRWRWLALGLVFGLAWWTNFLIAVYALPAAVGLLYAVRRAWLDNTGRRALIGGLGLAAGAFVVGSLPFWLFNLQNGWPSFSFLLNTGDQSAFANLGTAQLPFIEGLIAYLFIGLPALIGLRFPWSAVYFMPAAGVVIAGLFISGLVYILRRRAALIPSGRLMLAVWLEGFTAVYLFSRFSADPSGRYFLPLYLPLVIACAAWAASLRRGLAAVIVIGIAGYFAWGVVNAASFPPGLTTQFNLAEHLPNDDDDSLIAFMDERDLHYGYSTYWIAFRIAFLSGERIILDPALPPKPDLTWTPFYQRYPVYGEAVAGADRIAYVTADPPLAGGSPGALPALDAALEAWFADAGITYMRARVGIYTVYYDFQPITPRPPLPFITD